MVAHRRPLANGQIIAWVYARASTAEAMQAKVLTLDEARRVATNIARLPDLLKSGESAPLYPRIYFPVSPPRAISTCQVMASGDSSPAITGPAMHVFSVHRSSRSFVS